MVDVLQILIAEDNSADATLLLRAVRRAGFEFQYHVVDNEAEYLRHLSPSLDIIISDYEMPQFGGIRALELLHASGLEIPFIIVSGMIGEDVAVEVMKQGAADYLLKDRLARLGPAITQAIEKSRLRREQSKMIEALRESETRFREVVQNIEQVFWMTDIEKAEMLFVSAAYEKIWGRTCGSLYASPMTWGEAIHPEDRERVLQAVRLQRDGHYNEEYRVIRPDGSVRWVRDRAFPVRDANGVVYRVAGIAEDISERKRADERALEQGAMLDLAHDAIVICGFRDRVITYWNKGAEQLYGWSTEEAIGRKIDELIFTEAERLELVKGELLKTDEWRGENHHAAKCGRKLVVSSRATLVRDAQGAPQSVFVINTDITEQKELEARLLRTQRMESIGTLASGVAHDLNNILSPILMSVPLLRRDLAPEVRDELISAIELSARRGAQIVKQVLTFGRGAEGERRPLQLASVIMEVGKIAYETFPRDVQIEPSLPVDLWPVVGDATQLHQVVLNLCVNARDAMPMGGRLRLRARNVDLDESYVSMLPGVTPGPNVLLEVEDSGTGIPPETIERIFDPFFTTKGVGQGTGLGLSTVLGIVKSHGGHIGVHSEVGAGTTFQIYLPAVASAVATAQPGLPPGGPPLGHGECVLVVDDEEHVRRSVRFALEAHGYSVLLATDGTDALAEFARNSDRVALVLTDLMMPYMDGVALIHALRKIKPGLPIIATTGLGRRRQLAELERMHIQAMLTKPYGNDVLLTSIRDALTAAA